MGQLMLVHRFCGCKMLLEVDLIVRDILVKNGSSVCGDSKLEARKRSRDRC